eukprot:3793090-Amphidinium_carterae.1
MKGLQTTGAATTTARRRIATIKTNQANHYQHNNHYNKQLTMHMQTVSDNLTLSSWAPVMRLHGYSQGQVPCAVFTRASGLL